MDNAEETSTQPTLGHNEPPDFGQIAFERMSDKYRGTEKTITDLLAEAEKANGIEVTDDEAAGVLSDIFKRGRDLAAQLKEHHTVEKEEPLRTGQGVDKYFFSWSEKLLRRKPTDKPSVLDLLYAKVDAYNQRKLRLEQEKRDRERRAAEEAERAATKKRLDEEAAAREKLAAAERARKAEKIDEHQTAAAGHAAAAQDARRVEDEARVASHDAQTAAAAKPADMVRARVSDDIVLTGKKENYCDVIEVDKLDKEALWAFVSDDAKIEACKNWAKVTQFKRQMPGANIGQRMKTVIR